MSATFTETQKLNYTLNNHKLCHALILLSESIQQENDEEGEQDVSYTTDSVDVVNNTADSVDIVNDTDTSIELVNNEENWRTVGSAHKPVDGNTNNSNKDNKTQKQAVHEGNKNNSNKDTETQKQAVQEKSIPRYVLGYYSVATGLKRTRKDKS